MALCGLVVASASQLPGPAARNSPQGAYLQTIQVPNKQGGFDAFQQLINLNLGGTAIASDVDELDDGPAFGIWRRTGPHQLSSKFLLLDYDADGVLQTVQRVTGSSTGSAQNNLETSSGIIEVFLPFQDPTDPDAEPIQTVPFTGTATRLTF